MPDFSTKDQFTGDDESIGGAQSFDELIESSDKEMEWLIPPEQFVDFWIAGIFLLVGAWQMITILFLLAD